MLNEIEYAIGHFEPLDYSKATIPYPPTENHFTKQMLVQGKFFEPTEMTVLPNLDILVLQRRGEIMLYKQATGTVKQAGFLNVYFKAKVKGVNVEEGMLGLAKDPDFKNNHWIYIYYSPVDSSVNRLSRFSFENDTDPEFFRKSYSGSKIPAGNLLSHRRICCIWSGQPAVFFCRR